MSLILGILLGALVALALPRWGAAAGIKLGPWRAVAGALGGAWIHFGGVLGLGGEVFRLGGLTYGWTHSLLLLPLISVLLALGIFAVSQRRGKQRPFAVYYPLVLLGGLAAWLLQLVSAAGVRPLEPLFSWHWSWNWVVPFDYLLFTILLVGALLALVVPRGRRWVARLSLVAVMGYLLMAFSFQLKAGGIAQQYANAFNLEQAKAQALPGPLSPFNWRLIVTDAKHQLHDTMIHLTRTEPLVVTAQSKRAHRLKALYQPINQAVWRVYPRFGGERLALREPRVEAAWELLRQPELRWATRYAVAKQTELLPNGNRCVLFRDLRFEGARHNARGTFLSCPEAAQVYRPMGQGWQPLG